MIINPFVFGAAAAWRTAFDMGTAGGNNPSWNGYTDRIVIDKSLLAGAVASKVRLTMLGAHGSTTTTAKVYIGLRAAAGDSYDFAGAPTAVLFSGGAGYSAASDTRVLSDEVTFVVDGTTDLVVTTYTNVGSNFAASMSNDLTTTTVKGYYTAGDHAADVDAPSGGTLNNAVPLVMLELYG